MEMIDEKYVRLTINVLVVNKELFDRFEQLAKIKRVSKNRLALMMLEEFLKSNSRVRK